MKTQSPGNRHRHSGGRKFFAALGLGGLLGLIIAAVAVCERMQIKEQAAAQPAPPRAHAVASRGLRYMRMGQWRADARSAFAAISYLLRSESSNEPNAPFRPLDVALPTNSTSFAPKV